MKAIAITVVVLLAVIGGGVVLLGGGAFFMHSKVEARAVEIEEAMWAEMQRCAPKGFPLDSQREMVKKLAQAAAKMEMAYSLKDGKKSGSDEKLSDMVGGVPCPKPGTANSQSSVKQYKSDYEYQQSNGTKMDSKEWKFGDPISDPGQP